MCLSCCICISKICENQDTVSLPCGHLFHKKCAMQWYERGRNKNCAYCRREFALKDMRNHSLTIVECSVIKKRERAHIAGKENETKINLNQQIRLNEQLKKENFHIHTSFHDSQDVSLVIKL